ncbi:FGGY family carbohydrate kinase [Actinomadura madurae]|uniref:FGGY family carbohydrate kinase n=1 Tax=Actinomadura madurae TaxID=1993 RepID=UPI0020D2203C|nr:FGGY family carbohydrate kinase [Actinomadura madurae]MCQ0013464.1 FGGY family carbohydrate kinase [Actinomadura madurae]
MSAVPDAEAVWVGVDLGTQGVRALAVTESGTVVGSGSRPLTGHRDGPRHEQDPEDWWTAMAAACPAGPAGRPARGGPGCRRRRHVRDDPPHRHRRTAPHPGAHVRRHARRRIRAAGRRRRAARCGGGSATSACSPPGPCRSCSGCWTAARAAEPGSPTRPTSSTGG